MITEKLGYICKRPRCFLKKHPFALVCSMETQHFCQHLAVLHHTFKTLSPGHTPSADRKLLHFAKQAAGPQSALDVVTQLNYTSAT